MGKPSSDPDLVSAFLNYLFFLKYVIVPFSKETEDKSNIFSRENRQPIASASFQTNAGQFWDSFDHTEVVCSLYVHKCSNLCFICLRKKKKKIKKSKVRGCNNKMWDVLKLQKLNIQQPLTRPGVLHITPERMMVVVCFQEVGDSQVLYLEDGPGGALRAGPPGRAKLRVLTSNEALFPIYFTLLCIHLCSFISFFLLSSTPPLIHSPFHLAPCPFALLHCFLFGVSKLLSSSFFSLFHLVLTFPLFSFFCPQL